MQKRFLAILAVIATVFALGVGSALAAKPADKGREGNPACQKDDPPAGCADNGHPDDPDGDTDPEPSANPLAPLCDALGSIDPAVTDVCMQITDAVFGGGEAPEIPAPEPGGEPSCADLAQLDQALADGCQALVDALTGEGGGGAPPELPPFPPEGGEGPSCDQIPVPEVAGGCQQVVDALTGEGGGGAPPELPPFPPEGGEGPSCDQIPVPEVAGGCQQVRDALSEAGLPV